MYYGDHPPPHFHITSPDGSVKMTIRGCRVLAGTLPLRTIRDAVAWASAHERALMDLWLELNEAENGR